MNANSNERLQWGILGAGNIAKAFARGVAHSQTGQMLAIGSRDAAKAEKFAQGMASGEGNQPIVQIPRRYGSYEALLADNDVQAVYIATPHPTHAYWAIKAAEAKKHVLCEKPLALNYGEAMAIIEAARENDVFLMEAFMYRCHPLIQKLVELLKQRVIGDVRVIQASFSFHAGFNPAGRLWENASGGGGILDVGCYTTSMARLIAGAATGKDFADPIDVRGIGQLNSETGVDEYAIASLKFPGGIVASLSTGVGVNQDNSVRIFGSEGNIVLPSAWVPSREGGRSSLFLQRKGEKQPQEIIVETDQWLYGLEADAVGRNLDRRQAPAPAMTWDDTLGNMKTLDQWRQSIGLIYESEKPQNIKPVHGRPLAVKPPGKTGADGVVRGGNMRYGQIPGVNKKLSRLVMGVDNVNFAPQVAVMWDDFFERGGTVWDTAYIYGGGACEKALGAWIKSRGLREQIVILDKGSHTPFCDPVSLSIQHKQSLDRLSTDYVDIYLMHRDNPDVPVGEFVDAMNEHVKAGTMKVIGGSNWTIARLQEANEYARKNGKTGLSILSNQFSLARMVEAPWQGCLSASDAGTRAFLEKSRIALMPWSSQARGFFIPGRAAPEIKDDAELVRCWYSPDNFQRLQRANQLAKKKGVLPINIALAYVLSQPFPTFPLIGPRTLHETHTSLPALDVELTADEVRWLNLEA